MGELTFQVTMPELMAQAADISSKLDQALAYLRTIMSEDAAIQASTAAEAQDIATIRAALTSIAESNTVILNMLKNQTVTPETIRALTDQQAQLDALAAAAAQQAADEAAQVPPAG